MTHPIPTVSDPLIQEPEDGQTTSTDAGQAGGPGGDECTINPFASRMCERGTKGCMVKHTALAPSEPVPSAPVTASRAETAAEDER